MRRIFVDANVVIDWLNADSQHHDTCASCIQVLRALYNKPLVSPTSIAITFYIVSKKYRDEKHVKKVLNQAFSLFGITRENEEIVRQAFASAYTDVEDGIQYFSALDSSADAIVTFNVKDYVRAKIPVLHPAEFLALHKVS